MLGFIHRVWYNRRTKSETVEIDRRSARMTMKNADERLHAAISRFEDATMRIKRDDLLKGQK